MPLVKARTAEGVWTHGRGSADIALPSACCAKQKSLGNVCCQHFFGHAPCATLAFPPNQFATELRTTLKGHAKSETGRRDSGPRDGQDISEGANKTRARPEA